MNKIHSLSYQASLIAFSASWCGPCHKQIPILKELYQNLKGKLEITYVSIDLPETTQNWITLMEKEQIPWRSLLAKDKKTFIEDNYFFRAIPHTILVLPSMQKMIIDVRKSEDRKKSMIYYPDIEVLYLYQNAIFKTEIYGKDFIVNISLSVMLCYFFVFR